MGILNAILFKPDGERRIWTHMQNLNEKGRDIPNGSPVRHGRAWLHFGNSALGAEWTLLSSRFNLGVRVSTDADAVLSIRACVPPVSLFLSLESWALSRRLIDVVKRFNLRNEHDWGGFEREISVRVFDWALWWTLWRHPHNGPSRDARNGAWHPFGHPGARLGKPRIVETREVDVPMPEKTYRATATRSVMVTRGTPRWPFSRPWLSTVSIDFRPDAGLPVPGKGENSWDCDEDAIGASSFASASIDEAIGELVGDVLKRRKRYGGASWRPEAKVGAQLSPETAACAAGEGR